MKSIPVLFSVLLAILLCLFGCHRDRQVIDRHQQTIQQEDE